MIRCYITDRKSTPDLMECMRRFLDEPPERGDSKWIQIREKDLEARELIQLVRAAMALPNPNGTKFIVNGRMDVAIAARAAGLHLPSGSIEANRWRVIVRESTPAGFLIGVSCHTIDEVREAESTAADYALFGPVFAPLSKSSNLVPRGIDGLSEAARAVRIPVLGLGGITGENSQSCVDAGAAGVAGISMFQTR